MRKNLKIKTNYENQEKSEIQKTWFFRKIPNIEQKNAKFRNKWKKQKETENSEKKQNNKKKENADFFLYI